MVKIVVHESCGNAPKKQFLRDFLVGLAEGDLAATSDKMTDDVCLHIMGGDEMIGRDKVLKELQKRCTTSLRELVINTIVTHGYDGVAEGRLINKTGRSVGFCDLYTFRASTNNSPIRAIRRYLIALD